MADATDSGLEDEEEEEEEEEEKGGDTPEIGPTVPPTTLFPATPTGYHKKRTRTSNGSAGATLLDDYYPNGSNASVDRQNALKRIFDLNVQGDLNESDRIMAAMAGASIATLGTAVANDMERQMRQMRHRAAKNLHKDVVRYHKQETDGGKAGKLVYEYPEFVPRKRLSMWVNAESDHIFRNSAKGTTAGYTKNAWGGSLGTAYRITDNVEAGLTLTAMYGDFRTKGPDTIKGDMDNYYLSGFVRVDSGLWSHSFIGSLGLVDISATRTVTLGGGYGGYATKFDTDGYSLGLMYELAYTAWIKRNRSAMLQPLVNISWNHSVVDGFTERGSDAALHAGDQKVDSFALGLGARYQMIFDAEFANNSNMLFEMRALVKGYLGRSRNTVRVNFADRMASDRVRGQRPAACGLELGAGLNVPLSADTDKLIHSIFFDMNYEIFATYDNLNMSVGYKITF